MIISIDERRIEVKVNDKEVQFTPLEFKLLSILHKADGMVLSRQDLLDAVWPKKQDRIDTRTVDQHIARLRRKLGEASGIVRTVNSFGYKLKA